MAKLIAQRFQTFAGGKRSATTGEHCNATLHPEGMPETLRCHPFQV